MGCSSSSAQTVEQEKRPGTKPEESNGDTLGESSSPCLKCPCFGGEHESWVAQVPSRSVCTAPALAEGRESCSGTPCAFSAYCTKVPDGENYLCSATLLQSGCCF